MLKSEPKAVVDRCKYAEGFRLGAGNYDERVTTNRQCTWHLPLKYWFN